MVFAPIFSATVCLRSRILVESGCAGRVTSRGGLRKDLRETLTAGSEPGAGEEVAVGRFIGVGIRGRVY